MSQYQAPQFSETEQTPAQRWESVAWALGASSADEGGPSPEVVRLYKFYVAGDIDLAMVSGELDRLYPHYPSGDPHYPNPPTPRPVFAPLVLVEEPDRVFPFAAEIAALVQAITALPTRQPYLQLDV
ncbi:hypothetical protein [Hymenobacter bucti]|uniref:Uncharacterized protein n=1 Tax=Hymenobacter bucti TaxID=1844114 RepID=A0ABW4QY07_9BACT